MDPIVPQPPEQFQQVLALLDRQIGSARVLTSTVALEAYARDNTGSRYRPWAVVLAENRSHIESTLTICNQFNIPVVPRGSGTGNVGGALPVQGGVVLSCQRMNRIKEFSVEDRLVVVEPGVVNFDLQTFLKPHHLFWPPDPSSAKSCTIGGNIAMCSAGPNAVRYGVTRDWVLGLEAVLMDGTLFRSGCRTTKGVVGYDLTRLIIGSEGTLAVVSEVILKIAPLPEARRLMRAVFCSVDDATHGVCLLMSQGEPPNAIEFLDPAALDLLRKVEAVTLPVDGKAMLLLEVCGHSNALEFQVESIIQRLKQFNPLEIVQARTEQESATIWKARSALSPALKKLAPKRINEDVVVPVSALPKLIQGLHHISQVSHIPIVNFGHAGNGNIHVNLLVDPSDTGMMQKVDKVLGDVFRLVLDLGGTLTGEHGVGIQKQAFVPWELDKTSLTLQKGIKNLFDPKGLLNPGKIFP